MARPVTTLVIFFVAFNLFAGMLMTTGVAGMLGLDANVGEDSEVTQRADEGKKTASGNGLGGTLFGMYNVLATQLGSFFNMLFPGLRMLRRAGVPAFLTGSDTQVGFLPPLFSLIMGIGVMSFLRGWDL